MYHRSQTGRYYFFDCSMKVMYYNFSSIAGWGSQNPLLDKSQNSGFLRKLFFFILWALNKNIFGDYPWGSCKSVVYHFYANNNNFLFETCGVLGEKMSLAIPGRFSTFEIIRNGIWSFSKGFADSLRGAIELFFLDYKRAQQREQKLQQRDIDRELLLNRNSPVREIQNIAKKRAIERREKERLRDVSGGGQKKSEPNIIERTLKCCLLNGGVFAVSIVLFDNIFLPFVKTVLFIFLAGSQSRYEKLILFSKQWKNFLPGLMQYGVILNQFYPWHFLLSGCYPSSYYQRL